MPRKVITPPFYPIIYVRGYAMTQKEIEDTVATPFMGFNLGATKVRQDWEGKVHALVFESPLVRLMKDYGYRDVYEDGRALTDVPGERIAAKSVIIHRYYDRASRDLGEGHVPSVPEAARELSALIKTVRDRVCGTDPQAQTAFKVYLALTPWGASSCAVSCRTLKWTRRRPRDLSTRFSPMPVRTTGSIWPADHQSPAPAAGCASGQAA